MESWRKESWLKDDLWIQCKTKKLYTTWPYSKLMVLKIFSDDIPRTPEPLIAVDTTLRGWNGMSWPISSEYRICGKHYRSKLTNSIPKIIFHRTLCHTEPIKIIFHQTRMGQLTFRSCTIIIPDFLKIFSSDPSWSTRFMKIHYWTPIDQLNTWKYFFVIPNLIKIILSDRSWSTHFMKIFFVRPKLVNSFYENIFYQLDLPKIFSSNPKLANSVPKNIFIIPTYQKLFHQTEVGQLNTKIFFSSDPNRSTHFSKLYNYHTKKYFYRTLYHTQLIKNIFFIRPELVNSLRWTDYQVNSIPKNIFHLTKVGQFTSSNRLSYPTYQKYFHRTQVGQLNTKKYFHRTPIITKNIFIEPKVGQLTHGFPWTKLSEGHTP